MNTKKKCKKFISQTKKKINKDIKIIKEYNNISNKYFDKNLIKTLVQEFKCKINDHNLLKKTKFINFSYALERNNSDNYGRIFYYDNNKKKLLIDFEILSLKYDFFDIGQYQISNDENYLTYTLDTIGMGKYSLFYKYINNNKSILISNKTTYQTAFSNNSKFIYYITYDNVDLRPNKLYKYNLCNKKKTLIYEEKNKSKTLSIKQTSDNMFILLYVSSYFEKNCYIINNNSIKKVFEIKQHTRIYLDHWLNKWYILKKNKSKTEVLTTFDFIKFDIILPNKKNIIYEKILLKGGFFICVERKLEQQEKNLIIYNLHNLSINRISLFKSKYTIYIPYLSNIDIHNPNLVLKYTTFINPTKLISLNLNTLKIETIHNFKNDCFNTNLYQEKMIKINNNVFITILSKKNNNFNNKCCVLNGYGAYGDTIEPYFDPAIISLLDRDFIYCFAHVRGSSIQGYSSWLDGKILNKKNTFNDFIKASEWLINKNYTSPDKLTILGRSAGGLLIGSVINIKPELFNLAILGVPFVNVIETMSDSCLPLTTEEYEEWGNPKNKKIFEYMKSYDPIININYNNNYPNIYIYSNINDTLVPYYHVLKYYNKIKNSNVFKTKKKLALLDIKLKYGHTQSTKKNTSYEESAKIYSLIIDNYK